MFFCLLFDDDSVINDVFDSLQNLVCVDDISKLYAFYYVPSVEEQKLNSWDTFSLVAEYKRMGVAQEPVICGRNWRFTTINKDYSQCKTYPSILAVPASVSDSVIYYGCKYRSKCRFPALTYLHKNSFSITRASQPLVGLRQNRSAQDEKLVEAIFSTSIIPGSSNLIVDARPSTNAMANIAVGAGSENMDHYRLAKKAYLGIDNIHVMRESLYKLITALKNSDVSANPPQQDLLLRSHWLKHISSILQGGLLITRTIHEDGSHVLVHCSDGWDRTSQLCALPQLCLDPHYRTLRGFMTLVEKDWLAFGHRFQERCVPLLHKKRFTAYPTVDDSAAATFQSTLMSVHSTLTNFARENFDKYASPIFHQFLDSVWQLTQQFPKYFEFNERFLRRLLYHVSSCQYGSFLYNSEYERNTNDVKHRSRCVWDYFLVREDEFKNPEYEMFDDVLMIDPLQVKWWASAFGQTDENMNTDAQQPSPVS